jgi:hypothetical protein
MTGWPNGVVPRRQSLARWQVSQASDRTSSGGGMRGMDAMPTALGGHGAAAAVAQSRTLRIDEYTLILRAGARRR